MRGLSAWEGLRGCALALLLAGPAAAPAGDAGAVEVIYQDREPDGAVYVTRLLVTAGHLRIDKGAQDTGFILLDRGTGTVHSVSEDRGTVLVVPARALREEAPIPLEVTERQEDTAGAPPIEGHSVQHHFLSVNGKRCYDVVSVPALLDDVAAALREYRRTLAGEHGRVLASVPREVHEACDLALNVFAAERPLAHGLPVREWGADGFRRSLVRYRRGVPVEPGWFVVPEDFGRMQIGSPAPGR